MGRHILAIDVGTTSMRGILYDEGGQVVGSHSVATPLEFLGHYIEQSPGTLTAALHEICRTLSGRAQIHALSLTAFRSAPALVDDTGRALTNFIMWQDTRNCRICERLSPESRRVHAHTGAGINTVFTASKITWFKEHKPELFARAYKAMVVPDYLMCQMTGAFFTDHSYGSRTSLMNIRTLAWDEEMCRLFSLTPDILCPLIPQGTVYGSVTEAFSRLTGLPAGIPVISAGGDQQSGALGLGALSEDALVINCGTGSFVIGLTDQPYLEEQSMICNVAAIRGKYILESNILSSAAALNWFIHTLMPDLTLAGDVDFARFNEIAASSPPGAKGVVCVPLFQGCGTRCWDPDARATFSHLALCHTRADLSRALLEGIAAEIVKSIRALPRTLAHSPTAFLGGGMTKSELFDQILADMSGKELVRYDDAQATAIGAFISAGMTLGLYPDEHSAFSAVRKDAPRRTFLPNEEHRALYDALLSKTEDVYRAVSKMGEEQNAG